MLVRFARQVRKEGNRSTNVESELVPNHHHHLAQHVEVQNYIQLQHKFTSCSKLKWQSQWPELRRALLSIKFKSNCNRNLQHGYMLSFQIFSSQQHQLIQGQSTSSNPHKQIEGKKVKSRNVPCVIVTMRSSVTRTEGHEQNRTLFPNWNK